MLGQRQLQPLLLLLLALCACSSLAQNCGVGSGKDTCPSDTPCCSQYGYCGTSDAHCGAGCLCGCPGKPACGGGAKPDPKPSGSGDKVYAVYLADWTEGASGSCGSVPCKFTTSDIDTSLMTHINVAFAVLDTAAYTLKLGDTGFLSRVTGLRARSPGLRVLLSVGGGSFSFDEATKGVFGKMAASQATRAAFIASAVQGARQHALDGIDIDWEYPTSADRSNFVALLRELRAAVDAEERPAGTEKLLLTIAASAGSWALDAGYDLPAVAQSLDWINVMTYDMSGSWDSTTGPHTALRGWPNSIDGAVQYYLDKGVPASKLVVGLASYGRSWTLASAGNHKYGAAATGAGAEGPCTGEGGALANYEIERNVQSLGWTQVVDAATTTAYAYKGDQFVTYDTRETVAAKADYVCEKDLRGAMLWVLDNDRSQSGATFSAAIHRRLLAQPCGSSTPGALSSSSAQQPPQPSSSRAHEQSGSKSAKSAASSKRPAHSSDDTDILPNAGSMPQTCAAAAVAAAALVALPL
eukprot:m51a1_g5869 putative chitotriosidase-1 (525) ;mRNA; f:400774-402491